MPEAQPSKFYPNLPTRRTLGDVLISAFEDNILNAPTYINGPNSFEAYSEAVADNRAHLAWQRCEGANYSPPEAGSEQRELSVLDEQAYLFTAQVPYNKKNFRKLDKAGPLSPRTVFVDHDTRYAVVTVETPNGRKIIEPYSGVHISDEFKEILKITDVSTVVRDGNRTYAYGRLDRPLANGDLQASSMVSATQQKLKPGPGNSYLLKGKVKHDDPLWRAAGNGTLRVDIGFPTHHQQDHIAFFEAAQDAPDNSRLVSTVDAIKAGQSEESAIDLFAVATHGTRRHANIVLANQIYTGAIEKIVSYATEQNSQLRAALGTETAWQHSLPAVKGEDNVIRQLTIATTANGNTALSLEALDVTGTYVGNAGFALVRDDQADCVLWTADPQYDRPIDDERTPDVLKEADTQLRSYIGRLTSGAIHGVESFNMSLPELSIYLRTKPTKKRRLRTKREQDNGLDFPHR